MGCRAQRERAGVTAAQSVSLDIGVARYRIGTGDQGDRLGCVVIKGGESVVLA